MTSHKSIPTILAMTAAILLTAASVQAGLVEVELDIKPGACPNRVNPNNKGFLLVALVGGPGFDVTEVGLDSLKLRRMDGEGGIVGPQEGPPGPRIKVVDIATHFELCDCVAGPCDCRPRGADGIDDLLLRFKSSDLADELQFDFPPPGLTLSGTLADGSSFSASDCIQIAPTPSPCPNLPAVICSEIA